MILRQTGSDDAEGVAALQRACFPEPFPAELLFQPHHILRHLSLFPEGQWVVEQEGQIVASCTNMLVSEAEFASHRDWISTTGGLDLPHHDPQGRVLYGIDISVHPSHRLVGFGRTLYQARFDWVAERGFTYGTVCRLPGFATSAAASPCHYAATVAHGQTTDEVLTPLLRMGLSLEGVIENYMDDEESGNAGAILTWGPG